MNAYSKLNLNVRPLALKILHRKASKIAQWLKALAEQAWRPEFRPRNPHIGKREPIPQSCPLTPTHVLCGTHTHSYRSNENYFSMVRGRPSGVCSLLQMWVPVVQAWHTKVPAVPSLQPQPGISIALICPHIGWAKALLFPFSFSFGFCRRGEVQDLTV